MLSSIRTATQKFLTWENDKYDTNIEIICQTISIPFTR